MKSAISRLVTDGASSASPAATTLTACTSSAAGASLSRKPLAPARSAWYTYSSRSNVVSMSIRGPPSPLSSSRVAASPSMTGIRTSISTTSGVARRAIFTASAPSAASPATTIPGWAASSAPKPSRTNA